MSILFKHFYRREFPIEAAPVPVYKTTGIRKNKDFTELVSHMMNQNDRVNEIRAKLKKQRSLTKQTEKLIKDLLPTLDGFDRVLYLGQTYPQGEIIDNWLKSVESIYIRLLNLLETYGLYQLKTIGAPVDLNLHEVVEYRPSDDFENDTVIGERQKGYIYLGKLLREAKVVVAYNERRQ